MNMGLQTDRMSLPPGPVPFRNCRIMQCMAEALGLALPGAALDSGQP